VSWMALLMFLTIIIILMAGYPVAFTLAGVALIFAGIGTALGIFDPVLTAFKSHLRHHE